MSKQIPLTYAQFAHSLGAHARLTRTVSLVWHEQYTGADDVTRKALREEFFLNFLQGAGMNSSRAAKVLAMHRDDRTGDAKTYYTAAKNLFAYHVVRGSGKQSNAKTDPVAQLVAKFNALTPAQQRKFLQAVAE